VGNKRIFLQTFNCGQGVTAASERICRPYTTVRAKVHRDNTGVVTEIPVILTDSGPLQPLLEFLLNTAHVRSFSWMQKMTQAVGLLLDYMAANRECFNDPKSLFQSFVQRLYTGTIGEDGLDPSGLFWIPKSSAIVRQLTNQLSGFCDWMTERNGTAQLNPLREATRFEEMLNWAVYQQKHGRSLLAHTWDRTKASETAKRAKNTLLKRNQKIDHGGVKFSLRIGFGTFFSGASSFQGGRKAAVSPNV